MSAFSVIVAAGQGTRFLNSPIVKQYISIDGLPIWVKATQPFQDSSCIDKILIVCPPSDVIKLQSEISQYSLSKVVSVVGGGEKRQDSVCAALKWIDSHHEKCEFIFIHDGVRPFVSSALIEKLWTEREWGAVIPILPIVDTVKSISEGWVNQTLDRSSLVRVQTPQLFSYQLLSEGFEWLKNNPKEVTDDASLIEAIGKKIKTIVGEEENIKITVPKDLGGCLNLVIQRAEATCGEGPKNPDLSGSFASLRFAQDDGYRIGQGIDVHAFEEGNKIILGGIEIPYSKKLKGHSDADVLVHALCDSLLGAAGLEDIGVHFPDTNSQYKNISSLIMLEKVVDKINAKGYIIGNMDITVMAEKPKLQPYISEMKIYLSKVTKISTSQIAIKAKTTEGLGFIGREEGITVLAISTLKKYAK